MTTIEWTQNPDGTPGKTWNPVRGCIEISPGCAHCYAKTFAERWRGVPGHPYEQGFDFRLVPEKLAEPLTWKKPQRVFVNSMSDLWLKDVPNEYIAAAFGVMAATGRHTYMTLTKRADRMLRWYEWADKHVDFITAQCETAARRRQHYYLALMVDQAEGLLDRRLFDGDYEDTIPVPWPLPNAWVGVSVENRKHGLPRIDLLRQVPAAVRFLSVEPLLEDLGELDLAGIHWVIVGGESGLGARACRLEWIESVVEQCKAAGVPVFCKQLGARPAGEWRGDNAPKYHLTDITKQPPRESVELNRTKGGVWKLANRKGGSMEEWPAHLRVRQFPEVRA